MEFGLPRNSIIISFIANTHVVNGSWWNVFKSIDRIMMEAYNVISFHLCWSLLPWLTQWDLVSGYYVLNRWIGTALYHSCPNHALPWFEYNLPAELGTPTLKIVVKIFLPLIGISYRDTNITVKSLYFLRSFPSFSGLGLPIKQGSKLGTVTDYSQNVTTNAYLFWIPLLFWF